MPESTRVREHLANERTFLAWVRTGIALLALGLVLAKFRFEIAIGTVVGVVGGATFGAVFAIGGLAAVVFALVHYRSNEKDIESGTFSPLGTGAVLLAGVTVVVGVLLVANLVGLLHVSW